MSISDGVPKQAWTTSSVTSMTITQEPQSIRFDPNTGLIDGHPDIQPIRRSSINMENFPPPAHKMLPPGTPPSSPTPDDSPSTIRPSIKYEVDEPCEQCCLLFGPCCQCIDHMCDRMCFSNQFRPIGDNDATETSTTVQRQSAKINPLTEIN